MKNFPLVLLRGIQNTYGSHLSLRQVALRLQVSIKYPAESQAVLDHIKSG